MFEVKMKLETLDEFNRFNESQSAQFFFPEFENFLRQLYKHPDLEGKFESVHDLLEHIKERYVEIKLEEGIINL